MLLVTVPSALRLIQLDTCVAALVVKLPWLHVHPNSPVESLVMLPLTGFLRCLVLWILEPFSRNVFYENISKLGRKVSFAALPTLLFADQPGERKKRAPTTVSHMSLTIQF